MTSLRHTHVETAFTIAIDPSLGLVESTLRGLWPVATCRSFDQRLRSMLRVLPRTGCPIGSHVTLFNLIDFPAQQQQSLLTFGATATDASIGSRRAAVVTRSSLVQQQTRRVAPAYRIFLDRSAAMAWLLEQEVATAA